MAEEGPAIGIDLGTTFTCAAVVLDDQIKIIHGDDGLPTMASYVFFKKTGDRLIGNSAKADSYKDPSNGLFGKFKSYDLRILHSVLRSLLPCPLVPTRLLNVISRGTP